MMKKPAASGATPTVSALMASNVRAAGRGRRSRLYLWLRAHHDQLVSGFTQNGPSWGTIATHLGNNGLVDGGGKPPAPETVRATWYRVRRDVAAARARDDTAAAEPVGVTPSPRTGSSRSGISVPDVVRSSAAPSDPMASSGDEPAPRPRNFGLAQLRGHPSSAPPSSPLVPEPERIQRSPEEVARIITEMMSGAPTNPFRRDKGEGS
jgi:hypothetical protein